MKRAQEEAAAREVAQRAALERGAADADAAMAALAAAEARAAAAEDRLRAVSQLQPSSATGAPGSDSQVAGPPAMAGPGAPTTDWTCLKQEFDRSVFKALCMCTIVLSEPHHKITCHLLLEQFVMCCAPNELLQ